MKKVWIWIRKQLLEIPGVDGWVMRWEYQSGLKELHARLDPQIAKARKAKKTKLVDELDNQFYSEYVWLHDPYNEWQTDQIVRKARKYLIDVPVYPSRANGEDEDDSWIIVSSDKGLETDPDNRLAVIESKAKEFILEENNARAVHWASALIVSRDRIYEAVNDNEGPFYMNVLRKSTSLVWKFRVPSVEDSAATASPADVSKVKTRKSNSAE